MASKFLEEDDRTNPNKAEDNDLTRLDANGPGSGDSSSGTLRSQTALIGLVPEEDEETEEDEESGGMNTGTTSGITLQPAQTAR